MPLIAWRVRPRIRTVLLVVNGVILLLPLAGIHIMRLYENELMLRTETALISQGVAIRELARETLEETAQVLDRPLVGTPVDPIYRQTAAEMRIPYDPIDPRLDIYLEVIRPEAEESLVPDKQVDSVAKKAGERLNDTLVNIQRSTLVGIRVVDRFGIVIATTRSELGESIFHREEVARSLRGENVSLLRQRISDEPLPPVEAISRGARVRVFVALPIRIENDVYGAVILSRTPLDITKAMYFNRYTIIRYLIGLAVVVFFVSLLTATTIARPLQKLIRQTQRVRSGSSLASLPIERPGSHEIAVLSESIADMANSLQERAEYIQAFARNVSHEFKTPLASIQGTIELLSDHALTMSNEEQERFRSMISADAKRMERLVSRLLLLAQADMSKPSHEICNAYQIIDEVVLRYGSGASIKWTKDSRGAIANLRIPGEIFDTVLSNLIDNSRQHGGSEVTITIQGKVEGLNFILDVFDTGPGISEADRKKVFDAFFTTARETGRTGLGLAIVKSLVGAHGGRISVIPSDQGAHLQIIWPIEL